MAAWKIQHLDHSENVLAETVPENLSFTWQLGQLGPHIIDYELSLANPAISRFQPPAFEDAVGPYRTDFALWRDTRRLMQGMHTAVSQSSLEDDFVKIGGKSYLHYLEKRHYPSPSYEYFLANKPLPTTNAPSPRYWTDTDIATIVKDMLVETRDFPNSYSLDFSVDAPLTGTLLHFYKVAMFDQEFLFSKIQTLSQGFENWGFDFDMTPGKVFKLYPYEFDPIRIPIWSNASNPYAPEIVDVSFTNAGVQGTHALGIGSGTSTPAVTNAHFRLNSEKFRRLDMVVDIGDLGPDYLGDIVPQGELAAQTTAAISVAANPQHEVELTLKSEQTPNFWPAVGGFYPGRYIYLKRELTWHIIDGLYKIVSIKVDVSNEGDETAVLGLNQYWPFSTDDGFADA